MLLKKYKNINIHLKSLCFNLLTPIKFKEWAEHEINLKNSCNSNNRALIFYF